MAGDREANAIAKRQLALRNQLWPNAEQELWNRKLHKGFATIPKTWPLILKLMNQLTKKAPVSATYTALWCSTWDNGFVTLSKPADLANSSGFSGQRAEYTWSVRINRLASLGFIATKPGKSGLLSYALVINPHFAIRRLHLSGSLPPSIEATYTALIDLALEVGARDMTEEVPLPQSLVEITTEAKPKRRKPSS